MYIKILIVAALALISACSENTKNDDLALAAQDSYNEASTLVSKARSYNLKVTDAENELALAANLITEEKYTESITSSETTGKLASAAIKKYQQKQDELSSAKLKASKLAKAEEERLSAEAKMNSASTKQYVVKTGDSLWSIATASKQMNYDPLLWPLIFSDNQSVINDADLITPDMVLQINRVTDGQRLNKTKRHAQTRGSWRVGIQEKSDQNYLLR